ncbi:MAG: DEAD/DEAH box helicase, partial [Cytophagales bacterium]|nr:DEAD/DEAH box helicase [Cytophagales bacterium]
INAPGTSHEPIQDAPRRKFSDMHLQLPLAKNLSGRGFDYPTAIQDQTFEAILEGRDILGIANTGTGKTAAFLMPIIQQLLSGKEFQSLVVVPTRELAQQVQKEFFLLTKGTKLFSSCFIGGTTISADYKLLKKKNHVIIGTPGRLLDLVERKALPLEKTSVLILDEFDRMLDMGFVNDVKRITKAMQHRKQTLLFSATEDGSQKSLVADILNKPVKVKVSTGHSISSDVSQEAIRVQGKDKTQLLIDMIMQQELKKVLVFAETKRQVNQLEKKLSQARIATGLIHGNKSQNQRTQALNSFRKNKIKVLVATDVAARGIDVADITHVINFQVPQTLDSYIHRIGRTGRAGKKGTAITFID